MKFLSLLHLYGGEFRSIYGSEAEGWMIHNLFIIAYLFPHQSRESKDIVYSSYESLLIFSSSRHPRQLPLSANIMQYIHEALEGVLGNGSAGHISHGEVSLENLVAFVRMN